MVRIRSHRQGTSTTSCRKRTADHIDHAVAKTGGKVAAQIWLMTANRKVTEMMRRAGTPKASISSLAENSPSSCAGNSRNTAVPHRANTTPVGSSTFHACFTRSDCPLP